MLNLSISYFSGDDEQSFSAVGNVGVASYLHFHVIIIIITLVFIRDDLLLCRCKHRPPQIKKGD